MSGVELVVSAVLPVLLERLTSPELLRFLHQEGLDSKIKTWEETLKMIKAVLRDAEEKQLMNGDVQDWLDRLEDLAYDVEDILDEFTTDVLVRELNKKQQEQASTSKFHKFVSAKISKLRPKAIKSRVRMGSEIKDVKRRLACVTSRLEALCKLKDSLGLKEKVGGTSAVVSVPRLPTTSFATERAVYGREEDKAKILKMVLSDEPSTANFHVISIVGMGGIGKTTLARKVFNDEAVKSFELKAWVCVSNDFDVLGISTAIFENINDQHCKLNDLNAVQKQLQQKIAGKKFLFVLDDVWSKDHSSWEILRSPFEVGASGSKIIVTTRDEDVASTMRSSNWLHRVQLLSDNDCWSLFKAHAFDAGVNPTHPDMQAIHEKVVEKSNGLPLASKVLGGLLYKRNIDEWLEILNNKMWDLVDGSDLPTTLKLSYFYLPSDLKRCFSYCSIFLEDYEFQEEELVLLWLSEGLIQPSKKNKRLEDLGFEYFNDLLSRSLFQQSSSNEAKYVMHDLVRELAQWASRGTCFHLADISSVDEPLESLEKARHLSFGRNFLNDKCRFEVISKLEQVQQRLRTFLPLDTKGLPRCYIAPTIISDLLPKFRKLRMLSLENYQITKLPESIGDLKHLRHLNLSRTRIKSLPESTSSLINLLILKLKDCPRLRKLPSEMKNLIKLRYLDIRGVYLDEMPSGINELKDLQCWSNFIVGKGIGTTLKELKNLQFLCGELCISRLENAETSEMILNDKQKLKVLELRWSSQFDDTRNSQFDDTRNAEKEKKVLSLLQPHRNLEKLTIKSYGGIEFPSWVGPSSFSKLTVLKLESCMNCIVLPSLGLLESLKDLTIRKMKGLRRIGNEFCGQHCSTPFQSLETLCFEDLQEWEHWEPIKQTEHGRAFHKLREFSIKYCPKLCGSLPSCLPSLEKFVISWCDQLVVSLSSLPKLCNLVIDGCKENGCKEKTCVSPITLKSLKSIKLSYIAEFDNWSKQDYFQNADMVSFPVVCYFSNLCKLEITGCSALTSLPMEMNHRNTCLESLKLSECDSLKFIVNGPLPSSLKRLEILTCHKLEYLWDDREANGTCLEMNHRSTCLESLTLSACDSLKFIVNGPLPSSLKRLEIWTCHQLEYLWDDREANGTSVVGKENSSNTSASLLEYLLVFDCKSLASLSLNGQLPTTLSTLFIRCLPNLESIVESFHGNISLEEICIAGCEKLTTISTGLHNCSRLRKIKIKDCKSIVKFAEDGLPKDMLSIKIYRCEKLEGLPKSFYSLDSLKELRLNECPSMRLFPEEGFHANLTSLAIDGEVNIYKPLFEWGLLNLTSLTHLSMHRFPNLKCLLSQDFPTVALPSSLQSLEIWECPGLTSISELALPSSLQYLNIGECPGLTSISKLALPSSLESLRIEACPGLTSISELPSSLLRLFIGQCSNLRSITEQRLPSSLLRLNIRDCPMLREEWKKHKGKVWPNIYHIPIVLIDYQSIDELEDEE